MDHDEFNGDKPSFDLLSSSRGGILGGRDAGRAGALSYGRRPVGEAARLYGERHVLNMMRGPPMRGNEKWPTSRTRIRIGVNCSVSQSNFGGAYVSFKFYQDFFKIWQRFHVGCETINKNDNANIFQEFFYSN